MATFKYEHNPKMDQCSFFMVNNFQMKIQEGIFPREIEWCRRSLVMSERKN